jgi:hypothetical protein
MPKASQLEALIFFGHFSGNDLRTGQGCGAIARDSRPRGRAQVRCFYMEGQHMSKVATPPMAPQSTGTPVKVPHEKIAMRAYEKWCKRGRPQGTHLQDWLEAEAELKAEYSRMGGPTPTRR